MSAEYGLVADDIADSRQASRVARAFAQGAVLHCPHFMSVLPPASAMVGVQHVAILLYTSPYVHSSWSSFKDLLQYGGSSSSGLGSPDESNLGRSGNLS